MVLLLMLGRLFRWYKNVENILNTEFEITKSGLKAVYTDPDKNLGDKNIIWANGTGKIPI